MLAVGPICTNSPADTGAAVAAYFAWIDGKAQHPPAPVRDIPAALADTIAAPAADQPLGGGLGAATKRPRVLCFSIEDARTSKAAASSSPAAARAAAPAPAGGYSPPAAPPSYTGAPAARAAASFSAPQQFATVKNTPNRFPRQRHRIGNPGPGQDLYAGWMLAAVDAARDTVTIPEPIPPFLKA